MTQPGSLSPGSSHQSWLVRSTANEIFSHSPVGCIYRPNEAKVKNLKAKDYLGKARLIATSNTENTSTGFQGAERKQAQAMEIEAKDDRPPENISFAATNLVQRNLSRRGAREQSAPPVMARNLFPPTPPPETDKPKVMGGSGPSSLPMRTTSMRNPAGRNPNPPKQDFDLPRPGTLGRSATFDVNGSQPPALGRVPPRAPRENSWPETLPGRPLMDPPLMDKRQLMDPPVLERPRLGTQRTASEPRGPASRRQFLQRSASQRAPAPLYRETTGQQYVDVEDTVDDVYRMYATPRRNQRGRERRNNYIEEEEEGEEGEYFDDSEITAEEMNAYQPVRSPPQRSQSRSAQNSRRTDVRKIRVKVHANDDTRYIMIGPDIDFGEFESRIREKFGIKEQLKIKMQDEGDMITMGDQDDLDMLLQGVRNMARKERNDMGKMEVWINF